MPLEPNGPVLRTTPERVTAVISFDPVIADLYPFIYAANQLVTEVCANAPLTYPDGSASQPYDAFRLQQIETWLSAHYVAIRDPRYVSENLGQAGATYQQQVGLNLGLTPYGQNAQVLDTKGGLAWLDKHISQGKRARVSITWLGSRSWNRWVDYPWRFTQLWQM